ncbi:hypothetical protein ACE6H2_020512 [Prunus campanulata]
MPLISQEKVIKVTNFGGNIVELCENSLFRICCKRNQFLNELIEFFRDRIYYKRNQL